MILSTALWERHFYNPHLGGEEVENPRDEMIRPGSFRL